MVEARNLNPMCLMDALQFTKYESQRQEYEEYVDCETDRNGWPTPPFKDHKQKLKDNVFYEWNLGLLIF